MMRVSSDRPSLASGALVCSLTPGGQIDVERGFAGEAPPISDSASQRILEAFAVSRGHGVLQLGAGEPGRELHPTLSYWREIGQALVARACSAFDPTDPDHQNGLFPEMNPDEIETFLQSAPPMHGAEFITEDLLLELWGEISQALAQEAATFDDGLNGYLESQNSVWHAVGRVCFHLAENKNDPRFPFAFMATYVHTVSKHAQPQHLPLGRALESHAGAKNRKKLIALLSPLSRAAEQSELIRELVHSGDIYHPLAWTPDEAHRFLCEVALYKQAGLVVRVPDWWSAQKRPRPQVSVTVGSKAPSHLGVDALLAFDVELTLDGEHLSQKDIDELLAASEGLVLLKGRWVEVDREKLTEVLEQWREVQARSEAGGVPFGEAMRLLAGVPLATDPENVEDDSRPEWSDISPGPWLASQLEALRSPERRAEIDENAGLAAELRPYQKVGVQWLWTLRGLGLGGCLADDMGLGKTIQVLGVLAMTRRNDEQKGTDLIVVPASLVDNWRLEALRFAPHLKVFVAHPSHLPSSELKKVSKRRVDGHDVVITTYGTVMRTKWMASHSWRSVVLDEAQAIKNPAAKQTRAVKALESRWRLALTGTPVENSLGDLWSIFDFLNPGLLGTAKSFSRMSKKMASGQHGGYAPLRKLMQPYILRRLKSDRSVISDLPDKTEVNAYCALTKQQAVLYKQSVDEMRAILGGLDGIERRGAVLAFLMRFKQICNHPSQWLGDAGFEVSRSGKFLRLRELAQSIAARQDKALVFTQFREMTAPLQSVLAEVFGRNGLVLHGGTAVKKRHELVEKFQQEEDIAFMVLSLKAGGTGLNLTAASHVIHFDRWWNPAVENQATDRAFRIGQKKNVLVHKFICRGTVEERIDELLAHKQKLSDEILSGGAESTLTELSNDELISLVSLDLKSALER